MSAAGAKSANFNMRMDPQTKSSAESLFRELGMTLPQAVNMFIARAMTDEAYLQELYRAYSI